MTGAERVILAFGSFEKPGNAVFLTERLHLLVAAGEQLVRIALVADVPDELIARRVERVVKRNGQLDHAQPGADVASRARADVDQPRSQVARELVELVTS